MKLSAPCGVVSQQQDMSIWLQTEFKISLPLSTPVSLKRKHVTFQFADI